MTTLESDPIASSEPGIRSAAGKIDCVLTGTLVGFRNNGEDPLVLYPGQPGTSALVAACVVDLRAHYIGRPVALMFENGDPRRPMIIGLLRHSGSPPLTELPGGVEVEADGERLIVTATEQLVLRCGAASLTLTKAGKVLIRGAYVSNESSGVVRIKGGSVQLN
jgi:Domain of unknown function (DUF6484)